MILKREIMKRRVLRIAVGVLLVLAGLFGYWLIPRRVENESVSGILVRSQNWSGKVNVVGDIIMAPWATLTIFPGTEVTVSANQDKHNLLGWEKCDGVDNYDKLIGIKKEDNTNCGVHLNEPYRDEEHHISIIVLGTLNAVGTEEDKITIKSSAENPTPYDWNNILLFKGTLSNVNAENYRGIAIDGNGDVEISHNDLRNIGECGVCINNNNVTVLSNNISYAAHELIDMHNSSPTINDNNLGPNPRNACIVIDSGSPKITDNKINGCGVGILFISQPGEPYIKDNTFFNNVEDISDEY